MSKNFCIIQNKKDYEVIINNIDLNRSIFVPLNLETYLICIKNNHEIIDFRKFLDNEFHKKALLVSASFAKCIKFQKNYNFSFKSEIIAFLRYRLHSIIFLIEIISCAKKSYDLKKIIVSGIDKEENYVSKIIHFLFKKDTIKITNRKKKFQNYTIHKYNFLEKIRNSEKKILVSNLGYNFNKIAKFFKKKNYNTYIPIFNKLSILRRFIFFCRRIHIIEFKKDLKSKVSKKKFIKKIKFNYKKEYNISSLINLLFIENSFYFNDLYQKILALKKTISAFNFDLLISNISRGLDGSILDKNIKTTSLCISHGTITRSLNKYDKIYKKFIADAVFSGESDYFSIQSKIMKDALKTHKISGKKLLTGNLIFSSKQNVNKKKYFLFASTIKDFHNFQYLGVETFYEYWDSLKILDEIANTKKIKVMVKPHPTIKQHTSEISNYFKNLSFTNLKIEKLLNKTIGLISYSSSCIEDALNSNVPIILFDKNSRYKHINVPNNFKKRNQAIYYVSERNKLIEVMKKIEKTKQFNFNKYILNQSLNQNFEKLLPILSKS